MNLMKNWYLLKIKPKQEKLAILNLENQKYHVYCPLGSINKTEVVLFPGYIFILLDENEQDWSPIRYTKGVKNFVKFGLKFAKIPNAVVDYIEANELNTAKKIQSCNKFKSGESVLINDGVFKGYIAIFKSFKSADRVMLLMNLLGQEQKIFSKKNSIIRL